MPSTTAPDHPSLDDLAAFARKFAAIARTETLGRFTGKLVIENKAEGLSFDPVTEADRGAEAALRRAIEEAFPDHGIQGEEFGERPTQGSFSWSLDPIDGTRGYICGLPTWVTLIGLLKDGDPLLGLIDAPALDEIYIGTPDGGMLDRSGTIIPLAVSDCTHLADARLSTTDPYLFEGTARAQFDRLRATARTTRYGLDGYAYARLAAGTLDLVVECGLKPHDYNALIPVVRSAGGIFGDWNGGTDFAPGNVIAASSPIVYDQAVAIMRGPLQGPL